MSGSLILMCDLGHVSFFEIALSNFDVMVFVLAYFILFCYALLLPLRSSDKLGELKGEETN